MDRYKNACRICIKDDGIQIPIFGEEGEYRRVASKIKQCLNVPIYPNDPLPKQVCHRCFYKLELASEVKETCQQTNAVFIHHLKSTRGNSATRDYLNLVEEHPHQVVPPQQSQGQKRKLPGSLDSSEPIRKRSILLSQLQAPPNPKRGSAPTHVAVLPRSDVLSRTRSSGASPQIQTPPPTTSQTYHCQVCSKTTTSRKLILQHERAEHTIEEFRALGIPTGNYVCNICSRHYDTAKSLKMHSVKFHGIKLREVTPSGESTSSTSNSVLGIKIEPAEDAPTFECSICYQICADDNALQEHFTVNHRDLPSPNAPSLIESDSEDVPLTKPECIYCFQTFKNNGGLVNHLRTGHGKPSCHICLEIFTTQEELSSHRNILKHFYAGTTAPKTAEATPAKKIEQQAPPPPEDTNQTPFKIYTCDQCGKTFEKSISYARHKASHTRRGPSWVPQDMIDSQEKQAALQQLTSTDGKKNLSKNQLSASPVTIDGITVSARKLKSNSSNIPYCLYCKKIQESHRKLWDHIRKVHPNNPRYKCPHNICGRVFFGKPGYRSHLSTHKNDKLPESAEEFEVEEEQTSLPKPAVPDGSEPECFVCKKIFSNWNNLRRHFLDIHKSIPFFKCENCVKMYRTQFLLNQHTRKSHPQDPIRKANEEQLPVDKHTKIVNGAVRVYMYPKVLCRFCPKYLSKKYIAEHEKLHRKTGNRIVVPQVVQNNITTNEVSDDEVIVDQSLTPNQDVLKKKKKAICKYCDLVCDSFDSLRDHLSTVHSESPYFLCKECPEVYYEATGLKIHVTSHKRKIKHCTYCNRAFAYHSYLSDHEKNCAARKKSQNVAKASPSNNTSENKSNKVGESSTPIYTCDFCGAQFLETQLFVKHLQGHAASA